jgi:hypothetical protein
MLGCQPLDAIVRRDIATIILRSWTFNQQRENAWREIRSETRREEYFRFCQRVRSQWGLLNTHDKEQERQSLLEVLDQAIADVQEKLALAEAREAKEAAIEADCLAFDDSQEGERLRRYELAAHRKFVRSLDAFMKMRKAGADGMVDASPSVEPDDHGESNEPVRDWDAHGEASPEPGESASDRVADPIYSPCAETPSYSYKSCSSDPIASRLITGALDLTLAIDPTGTAGCLTAIEKNGNNPEIALADSTATFDPMQKCNKLITTQMSAASTSSIEPRIGAPTGDGNSSERPQVHCAVDPSSDNSPVSETEPNRHDPFHRRADSGHAADTERGKESPRWLPAWLSTLLGLVLAVVLTPVCISSAVCGKIPAPSAKILLDKVKHDFPDCPEAHQAAQGLAEIDALVFDGKLLEATRRYRELTQTKWGQAGDDVRAWNEMKRAKKLELFGWRTKDALVDDPSLLKHPMRDRRLDG